MTPHDKANMCFNLDLGNPPQRSWWFRQCFVYIIVMLIEKSIIVLLVQLSFWDDVRKFILTPFKYHPKLEAGVVMLIVPFIMNVSTNLMQFLF